MNYFFPTLRARLMLLSFLVLVPICALTVTLGLRYYRFAFGSAYQDAESFARLHREFYVIGLIGVLTVIATLIVAWIVGDKLVSQRARNLVDVARRFGESDQDVRNGPNYALDEIGGLAKMFDGMADLIKKRDGQLQQYYSALNQHAIVSAADLSGNIIFVNEKFCEVSGYSKEELLGNNHRMLNSGLHPPEFFSDMWNTITSGKVWHGVIRNMRKDGNYYWVISTIAPQLDANGLPVDYFSIRTDITALLKVEGALLRSEERLSFLVNAGTAVIYTCGYKNDEKFVTTYVSDNVQTHFGYEPKDFTERPDFWASQIHQDDVQRIFAELPALFRNESHIHEYRFRMPDGNYRWIHDRLRLVRNAQGNPVEIIGSWIDITERKRAELEREQYFRLFATSSDLMCIANANGYFTQINPAYQEKLGYTEVELLSKPFVEVIHPDDRQPTLDEIERYFIQGGFAFGFENRNVCRDGAVRLLSWRAYFDKKEGHFYATATDITERKKNELALVAARHEAERASQAKSEFLSRVTHELRTPLNFILGFAQLLEMESDKLSDMQLDRVKRIIKSGWHLRELIDEVLDFERIEAGNLEIHPSNVDLHAVLAECIETVELMALERQIRIITNPADLNVACYVQADSIRLKQVLLNLLSNAIKFNRNGGLVTIEQDMTAAGCLRMAISDTGPGIAANRQQELFKPFSRLDADKVEIPGAGIGLAISSRFMQLMGGRIGVESAQGSGSKFWIELPKISSENFFI